MKLAELQRALQAHVLAGEAAVIAEVIGEADAVQQRLGIYVHAYGARLRDALAETFPALAQALGAGVFERMAQGFVHAQPSGFASVRDYGAGLAQYLARQLAGPRGRGACELARWEWALAAAFDAPDSAVATVPELVGLSPQQWPALQLVAVSSMQLIAVRGNAVEWWRWAQPSAPGSPGPRPRWRDGVARHWLVWRQGLTVRYRRASAIEAELIAAFQAGEDFASLCDRLARASPRVASANRAAQLLHGWFSEGLVSSWRIGERSP